jgi:hypothetical protein
MNSRYHRNRLLLLCGFVVALVAFRFVGQWFHIPTMRGFGGSVAQPISSLVILAITTWVVTALCTVIAGSVRADAGLCCAAVGLMSLSIRGGQIRYTLFDASPNVFYRLATELVILFAILGAAQLIVSRMVKLGLARSDDDDFTPDDSPLDQRLIATAAHACATATLLLLHCRTDDKAQCLASVGISALLGSLITGMIAPVRPAFWYWISPMFVGILGYVWSSFSPQDLPIGRPFGYFRALAQPLPVDYASVGVAGAMLGYWVARAWQRQRAEPDDESEDQPAKSAQPERPAAPNV